MYIIIHLFIYVSHTYFHLLIIRWKTYLKCSCTKLFRSRDADISYILRLFLLDFYQTLANIWHLYYLKYLFFKSMRSRVSLAFLINNSNNTCMHACMRACVRVHPDFFANASLEHLHNRQPATFSLVHCTNVTS